MEGMRDLDWDRFLNHTQEHVKTELGQLKIQALSHSEHLAQTPSEANLKQQETQEIMGFIDVHELWGPLFELSSPLETIEDLRKERVLDVESLSLLRSWLSAVEVWEDFSKEKNTSALSPLNTEQLIRDLQTLLKAGTLVKELNRILSREGTLLENASPRLAFLYSESRKIKKGIDSSLEKILQIYSQNGVLQENFSDIHDGRYVIPVKISSQSEVDGTIYGTSVSRQTVFIEPRELAHLNNQLKQKQNEIEQEIYIILEKMSQTLFPFADSMEDSFHTLAKWDAIAAKAKVARLYQGKKIQISSGQNFSLKETAHPLLFWSLPIRQITRNHIEWKAPTQTLLLTGPNTGGKTVLLKTLGMAGLCARAGFFFPGEATSGDFHQVPFFKNFLVNVGDPQSIEEHLSSFSGHIKRFKLILEEISRSSEATSLVLLDELNTATDPQEGATLGRAFLETLMQKNTWIVATTHDPQLKALALHDSRILNASMAFDETSQSPTFRMCVGVPGRSRALETAERLGLPTSVIQLARKYLSSDHTQLETVLERLEKEAQQAASLKEEAQKANEEAQSLKKEWSDRIKKKTSELVEKTSLQLKKVLEETQAQVRARLSQLDSIQSRREIHQVRADLNQVIQSAFQETFEKSEDLHPDHSTHLESLSHSYHHLGHPAAFNYGEKVKIPKWKNTGIFLEWTHHQGSKKAKVQMGSMTLYLNSDEFTRLSPSKKPSTSSFLIDRPPPPASKIDLRGIRFEEAMIQLENYLDLAFRSGALAQVTIVHGVGTGALRDGTLKLLKSLPYIKTFQDGGEHGGGSGATVVEFDH